MISTQIYAGYQNVFQSNVPTLPPLTVPPTSMIVSQSLVNLRQPQYSINMYPSHVKYPTPQSQSSNNRKRSYLSRIVSSTKQVDQNVKRIKIDQINHISPPSSPVVTSSSYTKVLTPPKKVEEHTPFRDFSRVPDYVAFTSTSHTEHTLEQRKDSFVFLLHKLLQSAKDAGYNHIISWLPHGRSFIINDIQEFESGPIRKLFGSYRAFRTNLKRFGFQEYSVKGVDCDFTAFYHELFLRGRPGLCAGIVKQQVVMWRNEKEPNFYVMQPVDSIARREMKKIKESLETFNDEKKDD